MQRSNPTNKGKRAQKPYERITLPKNIQDRLSKYISGDKSQAGTPSRNSGAGKARRHVKVEEPDDQALLGGDEDQHDSVTFDRDDDRDDSEHEVAHGLQESSRIAHAAISSDGLGSEFEEIKTPVPERKSNKRPTQGLFTPLAKFHPQGKTSQPGNRPTIEELEKFANDMNDSIDAFCNRAKLQVAGFVNRHR
ncbi:hypothetical protein BJ322DRAFT_1109161 [Thelephora terrestris]|uniref:Uncharacterized protein n=1 Tax=Thelephora terrestris TaxID=56493 RepID=A0A9P6HCQ1_9AGAM|nr:hypothetical protein BJ322DRAFT_1109161 [Thelephora terrestris]